MRTIIINHLKCSKTRQYGLLKKTTIQDYETSSGIVREKTREGRLPRYYLLKKPREPINVEFI